VLDHGRSSNAAATPVVGRGGAYAAMWNRQKEAAEVRERLQAVEGDPEDMRQDAVSVMPRLAAGRRGIERRRLSAAASASMRLRRDLDEDAS